MKKLMSTILTAMVIVSAGTYSDGQAQKQKTALEGKYINSEQPSIIEFKDNRVKFINTDIGFNTMAVFVFKDIVADMGKWFKYERRGNFIYIETSSGEIEIEVVDDTLIVKAIPATLFIAGTYYHRRSKEGEKYAKEWLKKIEEKKSNSTSEEDN